MPKTTLKIKSVPIILHYCYSHKYNLQPNSLGISLGYRTELHIFKRGSVTAVRYRDENLEHNMRLYAAAVGSTFVLMDNNARSYSAAIFDDYLEKKGIKRIAWTENSPDLNPIENLWDALGRDFIFTFPEFSRFH